MSNLPEECDGWGEHAAGGQALLPRLDGGGRHQVTCQCKARSSGAGSLLNGTSNDRTLPPPMSRGICWTYGPGPVRAGYLAAGRQETGPRWWCRAGRRSGPGHRAGAARSHHTPHPRPGAPSPARPVPPGQRRHQFPRAAPPSRIQHHRRAARLGRPSTSVASAGIVPGDPSGNSITSSSSPFSRLNDRTATRRPGSGCILETTRTWHGSTARNCCSLSLSLRAPGAPR